MQELQTQRATKKYYNFDSMSILCQQKEKLMSKTKETFYYLPEVLLIVLHYHVWFPLPLRHRDRHNLTVKNTIL